jgi:hypothetical protein
MTHIVSAHFDGKVIVPDEPVVLPVGTPLRVQVEVQGAAPPADRTDSPSPDGVGAPRFEGLLGLAADLPDAPADLAAQHDHYLYGSPKR